MKKTIIIFCFLLSFFLGIKFESYIRIIKVKNWYPRISWEEFIKEQGYEGHITDVYIKNGCLEVGIKGKIIHSSIIETE